MPQLFPCNIVTRSLVVANNHETHFLQTPSFVLCYLFIFRYMLVIGIGFILVYKSSQEPFKIEDQMDQLIVYIEVWDLIVKSLYISNRLLNALTANTILL